MSVEEQAAYLLHSRKYTDTRIIVELLTQEYGRVSAVFRKSKKNVANLQAFTPLLVNWRGKASLKTITYIEPQDKLIVLNGTALYCGFYLNEILMRCLPQEDAVEAIFHLYKKTLSKLEENRAPKISMTLERELRLFELTLLETLGFGINFYQDADEQTIDKANNYYYHFQESIGFIKTENITAKSFPSEVIIAIREGDLHDRTNLNYAKNLCRIALKSLLGDKPLKSRELFR